MAVPALFVGLNNTGPEKGAIPGTYGTDYLYDSQTSLNYYAGLGDRVLRVMVRWERIQPTLGGALSSTELTRLTDYLTRAGTAGLSVILVINKGARFNELGLGETGGPTQANFADLWSRLSAQFKDNLVVIAYDNNEPHDFPDSYSAITNVATFDVTQENWTSEGGSGVTTARSTTTVHDGAGSLSCQKTAPGGSFFSMRVTDNVTTTHNEAANGLEYACWVFCPVGETGWSAQIDITDSTGANLPGTAQALTAGAWNFVFDAFTLPQVSAMQRKIVQIHNLAPTAGSKTFFIDSIVQAIRYTGVQRWQDADRAAVAAVRANGDVTTWIAAGYGWSAAAGYEAKNGGPWHSDTNVLYGAHLYADDDHSGTYAASYATETTNAVGQGYASVQGRATSWLGDFLTWLATHNVPGLLGEFGWPDDPLWNPTGAAVLSTATTANVSVLIWAVGEIEGTGYPLTPWQASGGVGTPVNSANTQAPVIQPYFTVTVTPPVVVDPAVVGAPPYAIMARDAGRVIVGKVDRLTALTVIPRFNAVGAWTLTIPLGTPQSALFDTATGVVIRYGDETGAVLMSGSVAQLDEVWDEQNPGAGTLTVTGLSDEDEIAGRLAYQVPGSAATAQSASEYDRRSGIAETVVKAYVNLNAGPGALVGRRVPGLTIETDAARGSSVKGSARMTPLLDLINPLALSGGIGWRVVQVGTGLQFQVYVPVDRSLTARFSRELRNLGGFARSRTAPTATAAVVGGGGDGTARTFRQVVDSAAQTTWNRLREVFLDRRDTTDTVELDQAATEAVVDGGPQTGLTLATVDTPYLTFGTDYGLGDRVTVEPGGGAAPVTDVLREVEITWTAADGAKTTSTAGTSAATGTPRLIRALQKLNVQVAALQAKK